MLLFSEVRERVRRALAMGKGPSSLCSVEQIGNVMTYALENYLRRGINMASASSERRGNEGRKRAYRRRQFFIGAAPEEKALVKFIHWTEGFYGSPGVTRQGKRGPLHPLKPKDDGSDRIMPGSGEIRPLINDDNACRLFASMCPENTEGGN